MIASIFANSFSASSRAVLQILMQDLVVVRIRAYRSLSLILIVIETFHTAKERLVTFSAKKDLSRSNMRLVTRQSRSLEARPESGE